MLLTLASLPLAVSAATIVPTAAGLLTGISMVVTRSRLAQMHLFGPRDSESLMNFSSLGRLRCVCGAKHSPRGEADRRRFCRSCGCEVVAQDPAALERHVSQREIKAITRSLRRAAIRASHLELPASITSLEELHRYLDSTEPKTPRTPPTQPNSVKQQVH